MQLTTIFGLILGIGGIIVGNMIEGGHVGSLIQGAAFLIVFGGTFGAVMVSSRKSDLSAAFSMMKKVFFRQESKEGQEILAEIIECSRIARKESILAIEQRIDRMKSPFLQNVMRTVVDGVDHQVLRGLFEKQIEIEEDRKMAAAKVWTDAGGFSPTIGIIGAVLGLIHVMGNLSDTSKLGAGIAVAFVATIYGVGFANLVFLPIANKLKKQIAEETRLQEMILEGGLCIHSGLPPTLTEVKLRPYLEPK